MSLGQPPEVNSPQGGRPIETRRSDPSERRVSAGRSALRASASIVGWLLWGWLLCSQLVYLLIATMQMGAPAGSWPDATFAMLLALVAALSGAVAVGLGRLLPRWLLRRGKVRVDRWTAAVPLGLAFLAWCLGESISLYGLILFFMSVRIVVMLPFTALALTVFALTTPLAWRVAPAPPP